jgi:hypothetical protein
VDKESWQAEVLPGDLHALVEYDAFCINQSDTSERNRQVDMMGKIYSSAQQTVICLGEGTTELEAVFTSFRDQDAANTINSGMLSILERPWFDRTSVF